MGNVPTKEDRAGAIPASRRGSSISSTITSLHYASQGIHGNDSRQKKSSTKEKEKLKELQSQGLVVKFDENVDGGYLAPYGTYNLNLDYKVSAVKDLIVERRLAPFYTPLQDYRKSWSEEELLKVLDGLKLHASPSEAEEEDEDLNYNENVDESTLSKKELKKHLSKKFNKELKLKKLRWQEEEEVRYKKAKPNSKQIASDDLKLLLYRNSLECPICFLYYPKWINYSSCCVQPICTECFVQIKRLDPHFPHDDEETVTKSDPNELISEPAHCPYCATTNFGITYQPPNFRTGINGILPSTFKLKPSESPILEDEEITGFEVDDNYFKRSATTRRRSSVVNNQGVVKTDYIRPDWEPRLNSARARLARRAATASAIHASNLLIQNNERDIEQRMIEEAMRLSLLDEEQRRRTDGNSRR